MNCSTGSDNNAGTTQAAPWKSLSAVNSRTFKAGANIYLAAGCTFTNGDFTLRGTGTSSAPITVSSYGSGADPTIQSAGSEYTAVSLSGPYQIIQHVKITNAYGAAVGIYATHDTVRYVEMTQSGGGVDVMTGGASALITHNNAHDLKMVVNTVGGDDDAGAVGYVISASDVTLSYNTCTNCKASSYDFGTDGGFVEVWNTSTNLKCFGNYSNNTDGYVEVGGDSSGTNANNMDIYNNIIVNSASIINIHSGGSFNLPTADLAFYNNTWYQSAATTNQLFYSAAAANVRNNIFYSTAYHGLGNPPGAHTDNLYYDGGKSSIGYSMGAGESSGNPMFMTNGTDFNLQAASPARGAGATGTGLTVDYAGNPANTPPDMGALQYQ